MKKGDIVEGINTLAGYGKGILVGKFGANGNESVRVYFFGKTYAREDQVATCLAPNIRVLYHHDSVKGKKYQAGDIVRLSDDTLVVVSYVDESGIPYATIDPSNYREDRVDWKFETSIVRLVKRFKNGEA